MILLIDNQLHMIYINNNHDVASHTSDESENYSTSYESDESSLESEEIHTPCSNDLTWLRNDLSQISDKLDILIGSIQHAHNDSYQHNEGLVTKTIIGLGGILLGCTLMMVAVISRQH